jgi:hypothetical protein
VIAGEASHAHTLHALQAFRLQRNETKRNALRSVWPAVPGSPRRLRSQRAHRSINAPLPSPQRTTRPRIIWRIQNSPLSHFEFLAAIIRSPRRVSPVLVFAPSDRSDLCKAEERRWSNSTNSVREKREQAVPTTSGFAVRMRAGLATPPTSAPLAGASLRGDSVRT